MPDPLDLQSLLKASASRHTHLCPRQVLGVRAALVGCAHLGLPVPRRDKRLLVIVETDGCFTDGLEVVTGASVGHRTLRIEDFGKTAATFIDVKRRHALRVAPRVDIRQRAWEYAPGEKRHYFAQLRAYQLMPEKELFTVQDVQLLTPLAQIISRAGIRTVCQRCGEEIINEREVLHGGLVSCKACAGQSYYSTCQEVSAVSRASI